MKKLIAIALMVSSSLVMAQDFEGYIKWKMSFSMPGMENGGGNKSKISIEDKAQLEASIQQMKAQLDDPAVRDNPQAKAAVEQSIKTLEAQLGNNDEDDGSNPFAAMFPKGMIVKMKNGNSLVSIEGGMMAGKTLTLKGSTETILINDDRKTFSKIKSDGKNDNTKFEVQKTSEIVKILGYNCVKYIVTGVEPRSQQKTTTILWTTTEIKGINLENLYKIGTGGGQNMFIKGVEGIPLKVESMVEQGSMKMEAIEYKPTSISDTEFSIPAGYKESASPY